ncbi:MAG: hypothetical protein INF43_02830 [Alphaproteobacteria bacterium]|nr:hypothetical protein [Alphaproteobacteria bacterium]
MVTGALHTLVWLPVWCGLLGLVGLGLLWPARGWLAQQAGLTQTVLAWWGGYAWLGWGGMFAGLTVGYGPAAVALMILPLAGLGCWHLRHLKFTHVAGLGWALAALLGMALLSLPTALTPPTEADTLAYHFALPQLYGAANGLLFAPVAVTFAGPQFTHMVSTLALALGGEPLLLAHAWLSTLLAGAAMLALARLWLPLHWAAVVGMVFLGTPILTYAFSNGTVELRQAGLMAAAALALALYAQQRRVVPAALFAALLGGVVASKTFGLFLLPPAAAVWFGLAWRRYDATFWRHTAWVAVVGLAVAAPWYVSNWWHYGSPVFPAAWQLFGSPFWSAAQQAFMQQVYLNTELMVPRTMGTFFSYPFTATFAGAAVDSDRTGLGPFLPLSMLAAVLVLAQSWYARRLTPLAWLLVLALGYYALWFFVGVSGRSRHLLPVYPLLLVGLAVVLHGWWPLFPRWVRMGLVGSVAVVVLAQSGMAVLLNRTAAQALLQGQSRAAYLSTQAAHYGAAELANAQLGPGDKLLVTSLRNTLYYLHVPYFQNQVEYTQAIPLATGTPAQVWRALQQGGFDAWLTAQGPAAPTPLEDAVAGNATLRALVAQQCAALVATRPGAFRASRTVVGFGVQPLVYQLYRFTPATCGLNTPVVQATS